MTQSLLRPLLFAVVAMALAALLWTTWGGVPPARVVPAHEVKEDPQAGRKAPRLVQAGAIGASGVRVRTSVPGLSGRGIEGERSARRLAESGSLDEGLAAVRHHRARRSLPMLVMFATRATDARVRIHALHALADVFGAAARPMLQAAVDNGEERDKVRREAARLIGRTGEGAEAVLERLIDSQLPPRVRGGAVQALAEVGTATGARRAYQLAAASVHPMRLEAVTALGRMFAPGAARHLAAMQSDEMVPRGAALPEAARVAVCRSLGQSRISEAKEPLRSLLLRDKSAAVRAAAARALGVLGLRDAMGDLATARADPVDDVARAARIAWSRLAATKD